MTDDLLFQVVVPLEFGDEVAGAFELEERVEPVVLLLDGVSEAFSAPLFNGRCLTAVLDDDITYLFDHRVDLRIV